jgi:hypothetical protein
MRKLRLSSSRVTIDLMGLKRRARALGIIEFLIE